MKSLQKKAKISSASVNTAILAIIIIVVLFQVYAEVLPEAQSAGNEMNDSQLCVAEGCYYNSTSTLATKCQINSTNTSACATTPVYIPLGGLLSANGIVFIIIMAALLVVIVSSLLKKK